MCVFLGTEPRQVFHHWATIPACSYFLRQELTVQITAGLELYISLAGQSAPSVIKKRKKNLSNYSDIFIIQISRNKNKKLKKIKQSQILIIADKLLPKLDYK